MSTLSYMERHELVQAIAALQGASVDPIDKYAPAVIAIFKGKGRATFMEIDDAIGNGDPDFREKGVLVRRVRNSPEWGKKLFEAMA